MIKCLPASEQGSFLHELVIEIVVKKENMVKI